MAGLYDAAVVREKRYREVARELELVALHRFQESGNLIVARGNLIEEEMKRFQKVLLDFRVTDEQTFFDNPTQFRATTENDFKEMVAKLQAEADFHP